MAQEKIKNLDFSGLEYHTEKLKNWVLERLKESGGGQGGIQDGTLTNIHRIEFDMGSSVEQTGGGQLTFNSSLVVGSLRTTVVYDLEGLSFENGCAIDGKAGGVLSITGTVNIGSLKATSIDSTQDITAPNITTMQNDITTMKNKLAGVDDEYPVMVDMLKYPMYAKFVYDTVMENPYGRPLRLMMNNGISRRPIAVNITPNVNDVAIEYLESATWSADKDGRQVSVICKRIKETGEMTEHRVPLPTDRDIEILLTGFADAYGRGIDITEYGDLIIWIYAQGGYTNGGEDLKGLYKGLLEAYTYGIPLSFSGCKSICFSLINSKELHAQFSIIMADDIDGPFDLKMDLRILEDGDAYVEMYEVPLSPLDLSKLGMTPMSAKPAVMTAASMETPAARASCFADVDLSNFDLHERVSALNKELKEKIGKLKAFSKGFGNENLDR